MHLPPSLYNNLVRPEWSTNHYIKNVIKSRYNLDEKLVLDFGCGTGACCSMFATNHYVGMDPDADRIAYAARLHPGYTFEVFDGRFRVEQQNAFDFILIIAVLHHISTDTLSDYLEQFHQLLKPQGRILVIEPCQIRDTPVNNFFMRIMDRGQYIRTTSEYLDLFHNARYRIETTKVYQKMLLYNEFFFSACH